MGKKRTFLDEAYAEPYNSVAPIRTYQGEIKADDRSAWRKFQDNLVKNISESKNPLVNISKIGAKTALGATMLLNPMETLAFLAGSGITRKAADTVAKRVTGRNTTQLLSDSKADLNPQIAELINPVNFVGGIGGINLMNQLNKNEAKVVANWARSRFNGPKITLDEQGNVLGPTVENLPNVAKVKRTSQKVSQTNRVGTDNKQLDVVNRLYLENIQRSELPKSSRINYGSTIVLPSTKTKAGNPKVFRLGDKDINYRRNFLTKMNKFFNRYYGYPSINLDVAADKEATETAIKTILNQHNTTVRGVRDQPRQINETNEILTNLGIEPTRENRLKYYATSPAGNTGAGRAGFKPYLLPEPTSNYGPIYTSNMPGVARGYGYRDGLRGAIYEVRRPVDYSSDKYEDWVLNADFPFYGVGPSSHFRYGYELPYAMKVGESLSKSYSRDNPRTPIDYSSIRQSAQLNYFGQKDVYSRDLKYYNNIFSLLGLTPRDISTAGTFQSKADRQYLHQVHRAVEQAITNYYYKNQNRLKGTGITTESLLLDMAENNLQALEGLQGHLKGLSSNKQNRKRLKNAQQMYEDYLNKRIKHSIIENSHNPEDLKKYYLEQGYSPQKSTVMAFPESRKSIKKTTKNTGGDPVQHIIYAGKIGEPMLQVVRELTNTEIPKEIYPNKGGGHWGKYAPWLSRKSRKFGGNIK